MPPNPNELRIEHRIVVQKTIADMGSTCSTCFFGDLELNLPGDQHVGADAAPCGPEPGTHPAAPQPDERRIRSGGALQSGLQG